MRWYVFMNCDFVALIVPMAHCTCSAEKGLIKKVYMLRIGELISIIGIKYCVLHNFAI
jgi:hypothetical protein